MFLPAAFCALLIVFVEEEVTAKIFGGLWALSTVLCLGWAFLIRHRHHSLSRACAIVGVVHIGLIVLIPALTPIKTRTRASVLPNYRARVDAGRTSLFAFGRSWPGATHRGC